MRAEGMWVGRMQTNRKKIAGGESLHLHCRCGGSWHGKIAPGLTVQDVVSIFWAAHDGPECGVTPGLTRQEVSAIFWAAHDGPECGPMEEEERKRD